MGDRFFTTTGADAPGAQHRYKPALVIIFLEIPENSQKLLPVLVLNFGYVFAFQYWYW